MKRRGIPHDAGWWTITRMSVPVLLGAVVLGVLGGQLLVASRDQLIAVPILLTLIPAVNGVSGNIGSVLGARVASGLHFGGIWSNGGRGFRRDVSAAIILAIVTFTFLGFLAALAGPLLGVDVNVPLLRLALTTLLAGAMLITMMVILVIIVGMLAHRFGWDPDTLVVPALTTAADILGIVFLLLSWRLVGP